MKQKNIRNTTNVGILPIVKVGADGKQEPMTTILLSR